MKNKIILSLLIYFLFYFTAKAVTVSKEDAIHKALTFMNCTDSWASISTFSISGTAEMYKVVTNKGWVLLSTEQSIKPILAYSYEDTFPDIEDMPEGMKWLFTYYEEAIAYAKLHSQEFTNINAWGDDREEEYNTRERVCLTRLGNVKWGQCRNNGYSCTNSYNKFCPTFHDVCCDKTSVGCGAVALGQVLWYYEWPHAALIPNQMLNDQGQVSSASSYKFYNWSIMPGKIYSTTSTNKVDEVAGLLRDCGYAERMHYTADQSTTTVGYVLSALSDCFGYTHAYSTARDSYNRNWVELMKSEIRNGRPVIYRGAHPAAKGTSDVGHFFVLYGFENNRFQINWGWAENGDSTFYTLDSLCVNNTHYNNGHYAILNIEPTYPTCHSVILSSLDQWDTNFLVQNGGGITMSNRTISSEMQGGIFSGDYVRLNNFVRINQGASVVIGIRDMHCDDKERLNAPASPETTALTTYIKDSMAYVQVVKFLRDGQLFILRDGKTYTITGQEVK